MGRDLNLVLKECALQLGATESDAAAFAAGEVITVDDVPIGIVRERDGKPPASALAMARMFRPEQIEQDPWVSLLLRANAHTMEAAAMGFHLDGDDCVLVGRLLPDQLDDPQLLATELRAMSAIGRSVYIAAMTSLASAAPA